MRFTSLLVVSGLHLAIAAGSVIQPYSQHPLESGDCQTVHTCKCNGECPPVPLHDPNPDPPYTCHGTMIMREDPSGRRTYECHPNTPPVDPNPPPKHPNPNCDNMQRGYDPRSCPEVPGYDPVCDYTKPSYDAGACCTTNPNCPNYEPRCDINSPTYDPRECPHNGHYDPTCDHTRSSRKCVDSNRCPNHPRPCYNPYPDPNDPNQIWACTCGPGQRPSRQGLASGTCQADDTSSPGGGLGGRNPNQVGNNPNQGGNNPNQGSTNPSQGGNNPNQGGYNPNPGGNVNPGGNNNQGNIPNQGGNNPNQGGNNPNQGGNNPNQGGNPPSTGGNINPGGNNPNQGGNNPNQGGNNPNQGGNNPNQGGNNPNQGGNPPNTGGNVNPGGNNPNQGGNNPNQGGNNPNQGGNVPDPNDNVRPGGNNPNQNGNTGPGNVGQQPMVPPTGGSTGTGSDTSPEAKCQNAAWSTFCQECTATSFTIGDVEYTKSCFTRTPGTKQRVSSDYSTPAACAAAECNDDSGCFGVGWVQGRSQCVIHLINWGKPARTRNHPNEHLLYKTSLSHLL